MIYLNKILFALFISVCAAQALAQNQTPRSDLSKERQEYFANLEKFKKSGRAAYSTEERREKLGDCPNAMTTLAINDCLSKEVQITTSNYKAYIGALRSVENLVDPDDSATTSEHALKQFDAAESAWNKYYEAQCSAAYDAYSPGTIAPSMELTCQLQLMRDRMHELEAIYQFMH